jgi:dUTP pyrophosphatase
MKINIHRIDKTLALPQYETNGSSAVDLYARKTVEIAPQKVARIPSNIIIKCPQKLACLIIPRSSLFNKKSLIFPHSIGLIDSDYCGAKDEILIQVLNFGTEKVIVQKGEKIAQMIFVKTEKADFLEVNEPDKDSRGGFGSTDG